jgi:muramoyltetrapeptide carboxypeptidase
MQTTLAPKLKEGDLIRVIAPARSLALIREDQRAIACQRLAQLGLQLSFGKHVEERDEFNSSSIESRLEDLHEAFRDPLVKGVMTVIGGFNSNQLLRHLDWDLIRANPKVFCGYSDITALQNAILRKTGLVTYSGPHFSTFGMKQFSDFTLSHFRRCLFEEAPYGLEPSESWSDDAWYLDQDRREFIPNPGYLALGEGSTEGRLVGGNLCTLNLLQGTEYMPGLEDSVLFVEDDEAMGSMTYVEFDRNLQSLLHLPDFSKVRALLIGRFQKRSEMSEQRLRRILGTKRELSSIPIIGNVDFGHTDPALTLPIGGTARVVVQGGQASITLLRH